MLSTEIQQFINVYSMIRFTDGHREPGIIMNKYNIAESCIEYFFIQHNFMNEYKTANEISDHAACERLSMPIDIAEVTSITPINLTDYKEIIEIHNEYKQPPQILNG